MRVTSAILMLVSVAGAMPIPASARTKQSVRRVELISMQAVAANGPADINTSSPLLAPEPSALPAAFRVHDLSRRYVEYRMAQEISEAALPETAKDSDVAGPPLSPAIASTSSIVVPGWMRGAFSAAPAISYAPGCSPRAYRPAGFLGRDAEARRATYYSMMSAIACEHGIPTGLFDAMIIRESGYNPVAVSVKNAFGFAQLMPATALGLGVNRFDPAQNMRGGARYLRQQLDRFGQVHLALAAYNAGPGRIRNNLVPQIRETQSYVINILQNWSKLSLDSATKGPRQQYSSSRVRSVALSSY